ncbi:hypothetical protein A2U01_0103208 [Trifolium medium]|uniref:Uncharacterized protein n=1 Tax=Trifolium medium TaxID=97028 RepID=A0A392V0V9_9FABA|nr:hypothetical protein [Trifolium medium]
MAHRPYSSFGSMSPEAGLTLSALQMLLTGSPLHWGANYLSGRLWAYLQRIDLDRSTENENI